ncbi:MAG: hypothetical protein ACK502_08620 [Alphaproteobacteria bacterium]
MPDLDNKKSKKSRRFADFSSKVSVFLATTYLCNSPAEITQIENSYVSPIPPATPDLLSKSEYNLLELSIGEIVDEFFGIRSAYSQALDVGGELGGHGGELGGRDGRGGDLGRRDGELGGPIIIGPDIFPEAHPEVHPEAFPETNPGAFPEYPAPEPMPEPAPEPMPEYPAPAPEPMPEYPEPAPEPMPEYPEPMPEYPEPTPEYPSGYGGYGGGYGSYEGTYYSSGVGYYSGAYMGLYMGMYTSIADCVAYLYAPPYYGTQPESYYGRLPDIPFEDAEPKDIRYRDMCVAGAKLSEGNFDPETGNSVKPDLQLYGFSQDYGGDYDSVSAFEQRDVGTVSGAKPPEGQCMPMKDTPRINLNAYEDDPNLAFAYFMNLKDQPFYTDPSLGFDAHRSSNYYRDKTFFVGGTLGCPEMFDFITPPPDNDRSTIKLRADLHKLRAEMCHDYYILKRSRKPWFILERPEEGTDDPYTMVDPERAFHNSCQPLVSGKHAQNILRAAWDEDPKAVKLEKMGGWKRDEGGFSKVLQFNRPDMDEAEYLLSTYLQKTWDKNFVNFTHSDFRLTTPETLRFPTVGLPCVPQASDSVSDGPPSGGGGGPPPPAGCGGGGYGGYSSYSDYYADCPPPYFPLPPDKPYKSPKQSPYYCPNVEKVTEPGHPFSPRQDITDAKYTTDREYSAETSKEIEICDGVKKFGYTDWSRLNPNEQIARPTVQCAIVPVDILSFRQEQFDICIMQRINHNFNDWVENGYPKQIGRDTWENGWKPPCKTRYWEEDSYAECPVKFSIQQCCRIIVKDVVPANMLKLRSCEGLLQKRREDYALQAYLEGLGVNTPESPVTHITNDSFGGFIGQDKYFKAKLATYALNIHECDNTEPDEYRFDYMFDDKRFEEPEDEADPPIPDYPQSTNYLGIHMPYMRWWDTGVSAGNPRRGGSFVNTLGSFDTLIGVGREERDKFDAKKASDDSLAHGADNSRVDRLKDEQPSQMGRIGGWPELKSHQMLSIRKNNLFCVGRYEKLFKPGSAENFVLAKGGAGYTSRKGVQWPWSLGWRGYVTDTDNKDFPRAFSNPPGEAVKSGLDNALPGDIITFTVNGLKQIAYVADIGGYAVEGNDTPLPNNTRGVFDFDIARYRRDSAGGEILHPTRVYVIMWDQGKFPSSTGISINWGMGPERTIYKERVPTTYQEEICNFEIRALTDMDPNVRDCRDNIATGPGQPNELTPSECVTKMCQPSCVDSDYTACVLPDSKDDWNNVTIYRPYYDVRRCNATPSDPNFDLDATYNWNFTLEDTQNAIGQPIKVNAPPDDKVIYQSKTHLVDTNMWASCVNKGSDPPPHYSRDYRGPQTGALTDTTLCAPAWWKQIPSGNPDHPPVGCSSAAEKNERFPKR